VVLGFTLGLALLVAIILSYAPRFVKESGLGAWLANAGKASATRRRQRLQRGLVVAQVAVSVILLTGAGLLTRTMLRLSEVDTGLKSEQALTMEVTLDPNGRTPGDQAVLYDQMQRELAAIPGIVDVGLGSTMPLRNSGFQLEVKAEGRSLAAGEPMPRADYRTASPDYFRAAGIPLLRGREFTPNDRQSATRVVILNQTLANRLFPNLDPLGRRVAWTGDVLRFIPVSGEWRTVIGVVGDTKDDGLDGGSRGVIFQPFAQEPVFGSGVVLRARSDAAAMAPAATRLIRKLAPQQPIERVLTVGEIKDESLAPRRLNAALVGAFGALAVLIAAVGIAGVLAFSVSARTNEIGIRMSLGADTGRVQRMVLAEGGVLLLSGLALGVLGSLLATGLIRGALFGVAPHDPVTLSGVTLLMSVVGIGACWIPALRAARIDPGVAIRVQ